MIDANGRRFDVALAAHRAAADMRSLALDAAEGLVQYGRFDEAAAVLALSRDMAAMIAERYPIPAVPVRMGDAK